MIDHLQHRALFELVEIALLTSVLFLQEEALSLTFPPNVQLTIFLIILFSKTLGIRKTSLIVLLHVILDNMVMGSFNLVYFPFMLAGWLFIPLTLNTIFRDINSPLGLAFLGILFALVYSWIFSIPYLLFLNYSLQAYLVADWPFEIILAMSSFLTVWWLYAPLKNVLEKMEKSYQKKVL